VIFLVLELFWIYSIVVTLNEFLHPDKKRNLKLLRAILIYSAIYCSVIYGILPNISKFLNFDIFYLIPLVSIAHITLIVGAYYFVYVLDKTLNLVSPGSSNGVNSILWLLSFVPVGIWILHSRAQKIYFQETKHVA